MDGIASAFKSVASSVSNLININPIINEACENSSTPTPGYLYKQIIDMTFESTDTCLKILELLVTKLSEDSPVVKIKALNVIKNCLQKGSSTFHREMSRKNAALRDCLAYRGVMDPLHGDALNSQVRDLSQQVINMMYDTNVSPYGDISNNSPFNGSGMPPKPNSISYLETTAPPSFQPQSISSDSSLSGNSNSFGNHSHGNNVGMSNSSSRSFGSSSKYSVVSTTHISSRSSDGNKVYVNSPNAIGWMNVQKEPTLMESMMEKVSDGINQIASTINGGDLDSRRTAPKGFGYSTSAMLPPTLSTQSRYTVGDVSSLESGAPVSDIIGGASPNIHNSSINGNNYIDQFNDLLSKPASSIMEGWEYKIVDENTKPIGRPNPPRHVINDFISKANQLHSNGTSIIGLIEAIIVRIATSDAWQTKLKACVILDSIIKSSVGDSKASLLKLLPILADQYNQSVQSTIQDSIQSILNQFEPQDRPKLFQHTVIAEQSQQDISPQTSPSTPTIEHIKHDNLSEGSLFAGLDENDFQEKPEIAKPAPAATKPTSAANLLLIDDIDLMNPTTPSQIISPSTTQPQTIDLLNPTPDSVSLPSTLSNPSNVVDSGLFDGLNIEPQQPSSQIKPNSISPNSGSLLIDFADHSSSSNSDESKSTMTSFEKEFMASPSNAPLYYNPQSSQTATLGQLQPAAPLVMTNTTSNMNKTNYTPSPIIFSSNIIGSTNTTSPNFNNYTYTSQPQTTSFVGQSSQNSFEKSYRQQTQYQPNPNHSAALQAAHQSHPADPFSMFSSKGS